MLTKDKAKAQQAKKALESGQSWKTVAKKYSIDQASKSKGGELPGVAKGQQEPAFDKAVFAAKKGKLTGPVKTQFGWYVFEVTKVTPTKQQTLEESKASIKQILASQNQQERAEEVRQGLPQALKKTTDCRKGYVVDDCKNAPKKKATTTTARRADAPARRAAAAHDDHFAVGPRARRRRLGSGAMPEPDVAAAVARLDELTRRLRRECPWDREQDERSIVPHTVEEAYELADAANAGDDAKLLDELGDVLFQVHFLSLLLEERGAGDMAQVAEHCRQKLIRRHPHVFGEVEAADAPARCCATGTRSSAPSPGARRGSSARCPRTSRRCCTRARSSAARRRSGFDFDGVPYDAVAGELEELEAARRRRATRPSTRSATCSSPPSTWRASCTSTPSSRCAPRATRFRGRVEAAERAGRARRRARGTS